MLTISLKLTSMKRNQKTTVHAVPALEEFAVAPGVAPAVALVARTGLVEVRVAQLRCSAATAGAWATRTQIA